MKRRGRASCAIYRKSFPGPSWCMRSADHSSPQRRDGPSIHIGVITQSGQTNWPARSLPLAARRKDGCGNSEFQKSGPVVSFRVPPTPFREPAYTMGPGHCCVCGQPIFRFGWHRDLWGERRPNQNATWHSCCVAAWNLWIAPSDHVRHLKVLQKRRCLATGERLLKNAEVDHHVPLFKVWHDYRDRSWPTLLAFWGVPNLQVINRPAHVEKCAQEAGERRPHELATLINSAGFRRTKSAHKSLILG